MRILVLLGSFATLASFLMHAHESIHLMFRAPAFSIRCVITQAIPAHDFSASIAFDASIAHQVLVAVEAFEITDFTSFCSSMK